MGKSPLPAQGTSVSIVLLVLPLAFIGWSIVEKVQFPFDQLHFLKWAGTFGTSTFLFIWFFSFWKIRREKTMIPITIFLYLLWMIGFLLGTANANKAFDQSSAQTEIRKVVSAKAVSGSGGKSPSRPYCLATLAEPVDQITDVHIKYSECELLRPGQDGLEIQLRDGALGLRWKSEHSIIRDFDLYRERLGK